MRNVNKLNSQQIIDRLYGSDELDSIYKVGEYLRDICATNELVAVDLPDKDGMTLWIHATDLRKAVGRRAKEIIAEILA